MCPHAAHRIGRQKRSRRSSAGLKISDQPLRVSVATDPRAALTPTYGAQLIKAALLYGDRVSVLNPVTAMLLRASELGCVGVGRQIEVLQRLAPLLTSGPETAQLQRGLALTAASLRKAPRARGSTDLIMRRTLLANLDATIRSLINIAERLLRDAGLDELAAARARGLLEFVSCPPGNDLELLAASLAQALLASEGRRLDESIEARLVDAFAGGLSGKRAKSRDWLLLDESVASLALRGREPRCACWGRLPTFPEATMDELLDIRSRISAPIDRVRRALSFVSEGFTGPPAVSSPDELRDAWRETMRPAIEALAQTVRDDLALRNVSAGVPGTAGDSWPGLMLIGPAAAGHEPPLFVRGAESEAATATLAAAWQRHGSDHEGRLPPFLFLYRTGDPPSYVDRDTAGAVAAR